MYVIICYIGFVVNFGVFKELPMNIHDRLLRAENIIKAGIDEKGAAGILALMGVSNFPVETMGELTLYSELLPKAADYGYTDGQRMLHFLWDVLDRSPICLNVSFSIPMRRIIAGALFKRCGRNFIAEEGVRFNFGQGIEVGDDVFFNRGVYLDSKGGIEIGSSSGLAENVQVFTHSHSESDHTKRSYGKVTIGNYVVVYTGSVILAGVTIGDEGIVAAKSLVARDVEPGTMVSGVPALAVRRRRSEGRHGRELNHLWLKDGAFQG